MRLTGRRGAGRVVPAGAATAIVLLTIAGCSAGGQGAIAAGGGAEAAGGGDPLGAADTLPTDDLPAVDLGAALAERVGTIRAQGVAATEMRDVAQALDAPFDPAAATYSLPLAEPTTAEPEAVVATIPLDLQCDGSLLAVRTEDRGDLAPAVGPIMGTVDPSGAFTAFAAPTDEGGEDPAAPVLQVDKASTNGTHAAWTRGPETHLYDFTWQLVAADLSTGESRVLAGATDLLGVETLPAFSLWSAPVVAGDVVYHASVLPEQGGVLVDDEDGSTWTAGLVAAPLDGGGAQVIARDTRLVTTDGESVVHLADGFLAGGGAAAGDTPGPTSWALVDQRLGVESDVLVAGDLPEGSSVTEVAVGPDLLVWVVSHFETEDATLLALDRAGGELHALALGDVQAFPDVSGTVVGWGSFSGNVDPGEYLWDVASGEPPLRVGHNPGGARVRLCGEYAAVLGTVPEGRPAAGGLEEHVLELRDLLAL